MSNHDFEMDVVDFEKSITPLDITAFAKEEALDLLPRKSRDIRGVLKIKREF